MLVCVLVLALLFFGCTQPKPIITPDKNTIIVSPDVNAPITHTDLSKMDPNEVFFYEEAWQGPCDSNNPRDCIGYASLTYGGDLNLNGLVTQVDKSIVQQVIDLIDESSILNKKCEGQAFIDRWVYYEIKGKVVTLLYPNADCRSTLDEIEYDLGFG
jgi:hypothetical protein